MKRLMITAAAIALTTPAFAQDAATTEAPADTMQTAPADTTGTMAPADGTMAPAGGTMAPADGTMAPANGIATDGMAADGAYGDQAHGMALSAENRGITSSWLADRPVYTTNQPSTTQWTDATGDAVPGDWNEIGNVSDLVMTTDGELVGYVADIGGFLGLGTHTVLLDREMLHIAQFGDDVVLATNYTQEELEALPEFDEDTVMN
ncbi:MAG: hypothetical protein ACK41U_12195 [Paracoccus sp. (in: a-proteobacteria)]|uniref:hypothetical protein n=1 Tax=Paracoccus sp. TaxID=267 RepID=UPI00391AC1D7